MKVGQRFWVSDYFSQQEDYLEEFEVVEVRVGSDFGPTYYVSKLIAEDCPVSTSRLYYFFSDRSPDVLSARLYKTEEEVKEWHSKREDYERRREEARKIFPEGFE